LTHPVFSGDVEGLPSGCSIVILISVGVWDLASIGSDPVLLSLLGSNDVWTKQRVSSVQRWKIEVMKVKERGL
jgi:hypothetical protein